MKHPYKTGYFTIRPEGLHLVVVAHVNGLSWVENFRSKTVGKSGPVRYADAHEYARGLIDAELTRAAATGGKA